jgi:hypothetical protein
MLSFRLLSRRYSAVSHPSAGDDDRDSLEAAPDAGLGELAGFYTFDAGY